MEKIKKQNGATFINVILVIAVIILLVMVFILLYNQGHITENKNVNVSVGDLQNNQGEKVEDSKEADPINLEDDIIKKLADKVDFESGILDELIMFKDIDFINKDSDDFVSNNTILRMGLTKANDELKESTESLPNGLPFLELKQKQMDESIKNIFGNEIKYKHSGFYGMISSEFYNCSGFNTDVSYNESKDRYSLIAVQGGGDGFRYIMQEPHKASKIDEETIELEQKIAFVKPVMINDYDWKNEIYKDYISGEFENLALELQNKDATETNKVLRGKMKNADLNTAKYTFKLDKSTNEYYLTNFEYK